MKNYLLPLLLCLLYLACSPKLEEKYGNQFLPLEFKMEEACTVWSSKKTQKTDLDYNSDGTWLEVGIRYKYAVLKEIININVLENTAQTAVFSKGPHLKDIAFRDNKAFGYYNPIFLKKVKKSLEAATKRANFNTIAGRFYTNEIQGMARTYYNAYQHINKKEVSLQDITSKYLTLITTEDIQAQEPGNYIQEIFRPYADKEARKGYDWYEVSTAPGFWVRRKIDGTDKQFFELLEMVMKQYDSDFLN